MAFRYWLSDVFRAPEGDDGSSSGGADEDWKAPFIAVMNERAAAETAAQEAVEPAAEVVAEEAEQAETDVDAEADPVESEGTLSGDENAAPKSGAAVKPVVDEARQEIDELAASYGLGEEETKSFATRGELEKALELLDRHLLKTGGLVVQDRERQRLLDHPVEQSPKVEAPADKPVVPAEKPMVGGDDIAAYVTKLEELGYDKEVVDPIKALHARVQAMESEREQGRQQEMSHRRSQEQAMFSSSLDALADEELFGTFKQATEVQQANVAKLIDAVGTLRSGLQATGRDPTLTKDLVSRAYRATFGKTIEHRGKVQKSRALIQQGNSRMGSSTRSSSPPKKTAQVETGGTHPEITKWWSENVTNPTAS